MTPKCQGAIVEGTTQVTTMPKFIQTLLTGATIEEVRDSSLIIRLPEGGLARITIQVTYHQVPYFGEVPESVELVLTRSGEGDTTIWTEV